MPFVKVRLHTALLKKIDFASNEIGIIRNRFIINACKEVPERYSDIWPEDFIHPDIGPADLKLPKEGVA